MLLLQTRPLQPLLLAPSRATAVRCGVVSSDVADLAVDAAVVAADLLRGGATLAAATAGTAVLALVASLAVWLWQQQYVLSLRARRAGRRATKSKSVEVTSPAYLPPRELWTRRELACFDGSDGDDGPILLAADGRVFNVAPARRLYGPGGEYHLLVAGGDATRYLARNSVEPESEESARRPLNVAERAALGAWLFSFSQKYDEVGRVAGPEEEVALGRREAYLDNLEALSSDMERERLTAAWIRDEKRD